MKRYVFSFLILFVLPQVSKAQLEFIAYVEYGYSALKYKSDELPIFLTTYNEYHNVSEPFKMKLGMATGPYFKIGVGMGANCKVILDYSLYQAKTNPVEARFSDGSGRDVWAEHRCANGDVGIRFGGTKEVKPWVQFDMNIAIQTSFIYSAYVYADGSRSLGTEKDLNGVYSSFVGAGGIGVTGGYMLFGPLGVSVSAGYMFNFSRRTPQYHQYTDLNNVKGSMQPDYLPESMSMYITDPYSGSDNSISNDFRGWKLNAGLTLSIGNWEM